MLTLNAVPAFFDNYFWILRGENECWVVDPGEADPVLDFLQKEQCQLTGILVTHHHPDHVGGIAKLIAKQPQNESALRVIGPAKSPHKTVNETVSEGQELRICGETFTVIEVPGHTLNHLAYYCAPRERDPVLLSGDTLFAGGCGRLFEGTPQQMHESLNKLANLPAQTEIYCAHEYTLANLEFALSVEPDNQALNQRIDRVKTLRMEQKPTVPSTLAEELQTNPFLRVGEPDIIQSAQKTNAQANSSDTVFAAIRQMKDQF